MTTPVNRLATPLPQSVLDRYHAEHPDEGDFPREAAKAPEPVEKTSAIDPEDFAKVFDQ